MYSREIYQCKSNDEQYNSVQNELLYCDASDAWAGDGFYFWESNRKLALWWGSTHYQRKFLMAKASYDITERCLDLHNSFEHQNLLFNCFKELKKSVPPETITLKSLINALRLIGAFDYDGIRFYGINSVTSKRWDKYFKKVPVGNKNRPKEFKQYIDLTPAIQLCLFDQKKLNFRNYEVIYNSSENESLK